MPTYRRKAGNFHSMSRALSQDESLSAEAIGVMAYLLSKPDDWEAQPTDVERRFKIGRDKRRRIVKELEDAGYMERIETRTNGKFDYSITIHETPLPKHLRTKESTRIDKPSTDEPCTGKPSTVNTSTYMIIDRQETDLQKTEEESTTVDAEKTPRAGKKSPPTQESLQWFSRRDKLIKYLKDKLGGKNVGNPEKERANALWLVKNYRDNECITELESQWRQKGRHKVDWSTVREAIAQSQARSAGGFQSVPAAPPTTAPDGYIWIEQAGMRYLQKIPESMKGYVKDYRDKQGVTINA